MTDTASKWQMHLQNDNFSIIMLVRVALKMITLDTSSGQSVGLTFLVHSIYFQTLFSKKLEQMGWKWQM